MKLVLLSFVGLASLRAGEPVKENETYYVERKPGRHYLPLPTPQPGSKYGTDGPGSTKPNNKYGTGGPAAHAVGFSTPLPLIQSDTSAHTRNPRYYNESCLTDKDCFGYAVMVCTNGTCTCKDNFVVAPNFQTCITGPDLSDPCETTCRKPFVCKISANSTSKTCNCEKPYKLINDYCSLECKVGETYDAISTKCIEGCKLNELRINSICKPLAEIGSACEIGLQCVAEYSECIDKKCVCRSGFTAKDGFCVADSASCPTGDPLKGDGDLPFKTCHMYRTSVNDKIPSATKAEKNSAGTTSSIAQPPMIVQSTRWKDTCPETHFCQLAGGEFTILTGNSYTPNVDGICCPKLIVTCPLGKPSTKYNCDIGPKGVTCPEDTHYCYGMNNGPMSQKQVCCPKKCATDTPLSINGKCLPAISLNEACLSDEQCTAGNAECINGICKCGTGLKEDGTVIHKYCTPSVTKI